MPLSCCSKFSYRYQLKELEVEITGVSTLEVDELPRREADRLALFSVGDEGVAEQGNATGVVVTMA